MQAFKGVWGVMEYVSRDVGADGTAAAENAAQTLT